jgi:hypothetical protein
MEFGGDFVDFLFYEHLDVHRQLCTMAEDDFNRRSGKVVTGPYVAKHIVKMEVVVYSVGRDEHKKGQPFFQYYHDGVEFPGRNSFLVPIHPGIYNNGKVGELYNELIRLFTIWERNIKIDSIVGKG